jgi:two-component system sensor histidine kinase DctS
LHKFARETRSDPLTEASFCEIVDDTLSFCTQRLKQHSIELRIQPIPPTLRVGCRPTEISEVLLNLLNNAVDAVQSLPERWVELSVRDSGNGLAISVTDSGSGIPEEVREKWASRSIRPRKWDKEPAWGSAFRGASSKRMVGN